MSRARVQRTMLAGWALTAPRWLLAIDLALIVFNALTDSGMALLNLEQEANVPTWYSSGKLLVLSVLSLVFAAAAGDARRPGPVALWGMTAALFLGLSMDETATLHEHAARWVMQGEWGALVRDAVLGGDAMKDAFAWVVLFAPLIAAIWYFLFTFLRQEFRDDRQEWRWVMVGLGLLAVSLLLETAVYRMPAVAEWSSGVLARYRAVAFWEEAAEVIACSCLLVAFFRKFSYWLVGRARAVGGRRVRRA